LELNALEKQITEEHKEVLAKNGFIVEENGKSGYWLKSLPFSKKN